ncbi:MAG TPA: hypothetical protein VNO70_12915 [Blastocatellia bacterium]|nr:hypothetical protein [Blastocatellia bacterium]
MKANRLDRNENGLPKGKSVEPTVCNIEEVVLLVEELEGVIAPAIAANHNETLVGDEVELCVEEMEEVIAPRIVLNHNETLVSEG